MQVKYAPLTYFTVYRLHCKTFKIKLNSVQSKHALKGQTHSQSAPLTLNPFSICSCCNRSIPCLFNCPTHLFTQLPNL